MCISEKKEREKETENPFKQIIDDNFPDPGKNLAIQVQEANRTPHSLNAKRPSPKHYIKTVKR